MSTLGYVDDASRSSSETGDARRVEEIEADRASRRWRTLWRTHFYAGVFAAPILVMFAITGLVILYTQPINDLLQNDRRVVADGGDWRSFDAQLRAVDRAYPEAEVVSVVVPRNDTASTQFGLDSGAVVFVDPYTNEVLGSADPDGGIVGLSNRLHGFLNNEQRMIRLPTIAFLFDDGPVMRDFVLGDVVLEIFACWAIVLVISGLYLWWPRKSRAQGGRSTKGVIVPRVGKKGRARWRDLHAIPGVLGLVGVLFVLMTGLFWSSYWAGAFNAVADKVSPNEWVDAPDSPLVTKGELNRLGQGINWNTADAVVPNTEGTGIDPTDLPARLSLDDVVIIAEKEGMKPGFLVAFPVDGTDDVGNPTFGSFGIENSWPRATQDTRTVYLDQFTGTTIDSMDVYGYGAVSLAADYTVSVHMGTQFGLVNRIVMTLVCVLVIWSVISAVVMYGKRRRSRGLGLPRRPEDVGLGTTLMVLFIGAALVFPLFGITALIVLGLDRFVIRRIPTLRRAFGQR
ncbi:MAG: PepSY domain-containing protein [Actinobacteria bacterium]|nr:PepSY domain-containing protein [Actinomycetota bacterium]